MLIQIKSKQAGKKTGYKPTGVLSVDRVTACIDHYAGQSRPLKRVILEPEHWEIFKAYAEKQAPGCSEGDKVDLDGVEVVKGSRFMIKIIEWEFKTKGEA